MATVELYLRGRLVRVAGWIEVEDRSVGIMGPAFCAEEITFLDDGPAMLHDGTSDPDIKDWPMAYPEGVLGTLTLGEWRELDDAFWARQRFEDSLYVYSWWDASDAAIQSLGRALQEDDDSGFDRLH